LSICYKKLNKLEQAIDVLNRTLIEYPKHYEAYIYRSKLFTKTKKFDRAKKDVNSAISIDPDKPLAYMAKGDCLRANNEFREAEKAYE
jgi:tetratricopeptide (TPR) repeat protein